MTEINVNYLPLEMTREEFNGTDFFKETEKSILEMVERRGISSLCRHYKVTIIDEVESVEDVNVCIDIETMLTLHKDLKGYGDYEVTKR